MHTVLSGRYSQVLCLPSLQVECLQGDFSSAANDAVTGDGVAIKKVTNVFSKKILAKRALREIKLLQHFRGHRNVRSWTLVGRISHEAHRADQQC